ncbi:pectin lyase 1 precursor [Elsinoe ampelina]|uniref:pectin lyase n=1 Tax=Elsinoe ampelina TaxID=302913 RepID=A0A6A6GHZ1_9PEZI|nr:pectin lyase 1 precursor [Elsinoe ampelina]
MKLNLFPALAASFSSVSALAVVGAAEGFAKGVVGGGSASVVTPTTNAQLASYLKDATARTIVLTKTFDFTGTEGKTAGTGCAPFGTKSGCQVAINKDKWCDNYQPNAPKVSVTYDNAGLTPLTVASKKTIIGVGSSGVIKGKGLSLASGATNVIIQNIHITNLNPHAVWGGDAITLNGADLVWIDHVKTSLIARQHIVLGYKASNRVTISNSEIDGSTPYSATCNGQHYWGMYFTGSNDMITLKGNLIHHISGRAPKVAGSTLLHVVNNYFHTSAGHAFEVGAGSNIVVEGNAFQNVQTCMEANPAGNIFTSPSTSANAVCTASLGRACQLNAYGGSSAFTGTSSTSFIANFKGKNIASAAAASGVVASVTKNAGFGKI